MNNFDWTKFTKKIAVKAGIQEIYNAWTIPAEIEKWFLSKANYFDENSTQKERKKPISKGDSYEWSWYLYDIIEKGKITEANGKDFLQFTFAGNCLVDVKLLRKKDHTIVELTQKDIPTDDESKRGIRLGCDAGWSFFMTNLKAFFEGGIDLRNKDADFTGMLNS